MITALTAVLQTQTPSASLLTSLVYLLFSPITHQMDHITKDTQRTEQDTGDNYILSSDQTIQPQRDETVQLNLVTPLLSSPPFSSFSFLFFSISLLSPLIQPHLS